jgi:hypothetical protein
MERAAVLLLAVLALVLAGGGPTPAPAGNAAAGAPAVKAVNYYPARHAWTRMWTRWQPAGIAADFERIAALGADTVRIVVAPRTFGYPELRAPYPARLAAVVRLAAARRLKVQLTLFDWWSDYEDVSGSRRWAASLLGPYAGDGRIAFVELQNELDPANAAAVAWARALLPDLRRIAGRPVALSARGSAAAGLRRLADGLGDVRPDVFSAHHFGPSELAYAELAAAVDAARPTPVLVGETGYSTDVRNRAVPGLPRTRTAREAAQDHYLRAVALAAWALGLAPPAPWVFSDFGERAIPPGGPTTRIERRYGLYRLDGSAKPAVATVRRAFATGRISRAFNNGFERPGGRSARAAPAEWQLRGAANTRVGRDSRVARTGSASARIASVDGRPTGRPALYVSPLELPLAGSHYAASVWARGDGAVGGTRIALAWFDAGGNELARAQSQPLGGGRGWSLLRAEAAAPPAAAFARLFLESEGSRGTVWFDDVTFRRAPGA